VSAYRRAGVSACRREEGYRRVGVSACRREEAYRRVGVSACRREEGPYSRDAFPLAFDEPPVCVVNHFNDLAKDLIAGVIKFVEDRLVQVAM